MQPIQYDADGRVVIDAVGAVACYANGLPFTADGAPAVSTGDVLAVQNGIPTDVDGKVTVSE